MLLVLKGKSVLIRQKTKNWASSTNLTLKMTLQLDNYLLKVRAPRLAQRTLTVNSEVITTEVRSIIAAVTMAAANKSVNAGGRRQLVTHRVMPDTRSQMRWT